MTQYITGRTYEELYSFLLRLERWGTECKKICYVHNLSFEFQFLRNIFKFDKVISRKNHKVMKCTLLDFNIEFRCTLYMTNAPLKKLPKIYNLDVEKLVGDLNYDTLRHSKTLLTKKELKYCENDCLVVYEYIKRELENYEDVKSAPLTSTGHVRRELKDRIKKDYKYRNKVRNAVNIDGHIYNLLIEAFAGGYTHANYIYTDEIIKDVESYDFTSSYPYVMTCFNKFPVSEFRKCNIKKVNEMLDCFAYLVVVEFKDLKCKYYNTFISQNKCRYIKKGRFDNGRIISAEEIEIVLTDIDLKFILQAYKGTYTIRECYFAKYGYLPKQLIEFILEKYIKKTEYKGLKDKELEYNLEKAKFNSIYGMSVTNNIRDKVIFDNLEGWKEEELTNEEIIKKLEIEKKQAFLSFAYGVWVTSIARNNLLKNVIKLDEQTIYCDTDSLKIKKPFDISVIENYNKEVEKQVEKASKDLEIPIEKFSPKDIKGKTHMLGLFDHDKSYSQFITQGAKKYAYIDREDYKIHITVSGVPKEGAKALKSLEDFKDGLVFDYKYTGKNLLQYNDEMKPFELIDYKGKKYTVKDKFGCVILPTTYNLGKSLEYAKLLSDDSSERSIFREG